MLNEFMVHYDKVHARREAEEKEDSDNEHAKLIP